MGWLAPGLAPAEPAAAGGFELALADASGSGETSQTGSEDVPAAGRWTFLPEGELFELPRAALHEPQSYAAWQRWRTEFGTFDIGMAAFGGSFPLVRFQDRSANAIQAGISASAYSFFNFDGDDNDLVNTDFVVGAPLSFRHGPLSLRARYYHQSSHVDRSFLLVFTPGNRTRKLSLEALELLAGWDVGELRLYAGPTRIVSTQRNVERNSVRAGVDLKHPWGESVRGFLSADVDFRAQTGWRGDLHGILGVEFRRASWQHTVSLFLDAYHGQIPWGPFDEFEVDWWGLGVGFRF